MITLLTKLKDLDIGWNEHPLDEDDFYRICERFGVCVDELPMRVGGFYFRIKGHDHIAINSTLPPGEKLFVMFHELGHFLFHAPGFDTMAKFHSVGGRSRAESEADLFAACALIPRPRLTSLTPEELIADGADQDIIARRIEAFECFGI
ncbi:MAG: ImmA/IrrE family metallo-endopeptidase [Acidobacteria bacterium]|nr:ImmA/IrrE family metallo-endopeptidase [Acidobacteriota bacterium]